MSAIILQFVSTNTLGSKLIEWFDHSKYSHVDSVLPDGTLLGARSGKIGNVGEGVQIRQPAYEDFDHKLVVRLEAPQVVVDAYYYFLHQQLGKPYDMTAIVGFAAGRDWMEDDSWFCSELVAAGLVVSGYLHNLAAPSNKIAPGDLLLVCSAMTQIEIP